MRRAQSCVRAVEHWMAANRLRLNPEKTELIWIGAKHNLLKIHGGGPPLTLGGTYITTSDVVRVLGVLLTPWTSTLLHSAPSAFFSRDNYATSDVRSRTTPSLTLVRAFVASRVDHCVGLLAGARRRRRTSCNASSTRLHESYRTAASTTED